MSVHKSLINDLIDMHIDAKQLTGTCKGPAFYKTPFVLTLTLANSYHCTVDSKTSYNVRSHPVIYICKWICRFNSLLEFPRPSSIRC